MGSEREKKKEGESERVTKREREAHYFKVDHSDLVDQSKNELYLGRRSINQSKSNDQIIDSMKIDQPYIYVSLIILKNN